MSHSTPPLPPDPPQPPLVDDEGSADRLSASAGNGEGVVMQLWRHPWGRVLMASMTVAVLFWALRETAFITAPILLALRDILIPLAIGFTIAYVLSPVVDAVSRWGVHRLLATVVLFAVMSVVTVVLLSLVVPAVVRQGVDLGNRLVSEFYYVDVDADNRYSRGDIRVSPLPGQPGYFFEDSLGTGQWTADQPRYHRDSARVQLENSLLAKFGAWVDRQSGPLRRVMGIPLDQEAQRELAFYAQETAPIIAALDDGLAAARSDPPLSPWPFLAIDEAEVSTMRSAESLRWPGVWSEEVSELAQSLEPALRDRWLAAMGHLVHQFHQKHRALSAAIDRVRGGGGEENEMVARLRVALRQELSDESEQRMNALHDRLMHSEQGDNGAYAGRLLATLRGTEEGGSAFLRDLAQRINDTISGELGGVAGTAGGWLRSVLSNVPALLVLGLNVILVPIYAFFLTLALPRIRRYLRGGVERYGGQQGLRLAHGIERVVSAFFRGRLIVCAICAVLVYVGFVMLQVPYAALFALFIGLATAIPLAGLVFLVPAVLLMLLDGGDGMVLRISLVIAVYTVVQTLESTVFTPLIMGREVELHPVTLIIALLFFGKLFGLLGLILAVPIAATLRILIREFIQPRLRGWNERRRRGQQTVDGDECASHP